MPDDVTARVAQIKARCEKATEGPWCWEATGEKSNDYAVGTATTPDGKPVSGRLVVTDDPDTGHWLDDEIIRRHLVGEGEGRLADADFIAHAREDLPWCLAQIERLQKRIANAEAALRDFGIVRSGGSDGD